MVYGYHPVLVEPVSTLVHGGQTQLRLELAWYGVNPRDCAFFAPLCGAATSRKARVPVPGAWRFHAYTSPADVQELEARYRALWEAEKVAGLSADLLLCMELRDAYFLWRVSRTPTVYYPALIFLQDEALTDFAADYYLRQFDELSKHDVLAPSASSSQRGHGPPTAIVAQSPYIAENVFYHTKRRVPAVRPLALYVGVHYAPNSTDAAPSGGTLRLLVLCARTRLMMSHACRALFREARRELPRRTSLRLHLPTGDGDTVHGLTFADVARFDAAVLVPWNIAVTTFAELYAMQVPVFVPDPVWLARLWPKQMTSYGRAHPDLHRELREGKLGEAQHPTPYPSLDRLTEDFPSMLYWAEHYAHLHGLPGVKSFASIPTLLLSLHKGDTDLRAASVEMRKEGERALREVVPFWAGLFARLLYPDADSGGIEAGGATNMTCVVW